MSSIFNKFKDLLKIDDIHKLEVCKHMYQVNSKQYAGHAKNLAYNAGEISGVLISRMFLHEFFHI